MARQTRRTDGIFYRSFDDSWYSSVTGDYRPLRNEVGDKIKGKDNEVEAKKAFYRAAIKAGDTATLYVNGCATPYPVQVMQWGLYNQSGIVQPVGPTSAHEHYLLLVPNNSTLSVVADVPIQQTFPSTSNSR
jgi:hypothetical protein